MRRLGTFGSSIFMVVFTFFLLITFFTSLASAFICPRGSVIEGATTPCGACKGVINEIGDGVVYHLVFCTPQAAAGYEAAKKVGRAKVIGAFLGGGPTPCDSLDYAIICEFLKQILGADFTCAWGPTTGLFLATEVIPKPSAPPNLEVPIGGNFNFGEFLDPCGEHNSFPAFWLLK